MWNKELVLTVGLLEAPKETKQNLVEYDTKNIRKSHRTFV